MRPPDAIKVVRLVRELWSKYSHSRIYRMLHSNSPEIVQLDGARYATAEKDWSGYLLFGPYAPLPQGRSVVGVDIGAYSSQKSPGQFEIFHTIGNAPLVSVPLPLTHFGGKIWLEVNLPTTMFGIEYRVFANGAVPLRVKIAIDVLSDF